MICMKNTCRARPGTVARIFGLLLLLCSLSAVAQAQEAGFRAGTKTVPFLITGKLPHLTGLLMKQWDSPELGLSPQQKRWLKLVREETISDIKRLSKKISELEGQVVDGINSGMEPDLLYPKVKEIARLKTEATMVHLKCLYDTRKILRPEQLKLLLETGSASGR